MVELQMDDRKAERTGYRASLIGLRQAERDYSELADRIRLEVRHAVRRMIQEESSMIIQSQNVRDNEVRLTAARLRYEEGLIDNRDVVDAINDLQDAKDRLAQAQARRRQAVLAFLRDTGTLRVGDDGGLLDGSAEIR